MNFDTTPGNNIFLYSFLNYLLDDRENKFSETDYYLNCLGRTHHFYIRDGNALIYLRMTSKII